MWAATAMVIGLTSGCNPPAKSASTSHVVFALQYAASISPVSESYKLEVSGNRIKIRCNPRYEIVESHLNGTSVRISSSASVVNALSLHTISNETQLEATLRCEQLRNERVIDALDKALSNARDITVRFSEFQVLGLPKRTVNVKTSDHFLDFVIIMFDEKNNFERVITH